MPLVIDYNDFINSSASWAGDNTNPPSQPHLYKRIAENITDLSSDDRIIIFSNLPAGMQVRNPPQTTAPYDSVFLDINGYEDYVLLKTELDGYWAGEGFLAAYTSEGYWAFGEPNGGSPNCILTGAGNIDTDIADIQWYPISPSDNGNVAPSPFDNTIFSIGNGDYSWNETIPNEIFTSYDVISTSGIQIRETNNELVPFNDIPSALRNLYVLFSSPL